MDSDTIWTELYDKGFENHSYLDSIEKKQLFYFIDLIYQIEMGGFIYNQSPTNPVENFYSPYIESLIYFHREKLASEISHYNALYQKSLKEWDFDKNLDFEDFLKNNSVNQLGEKLDSLLYTMRENYDDIFDWIEKNKYLLTQPKNNPSGR